MLELSTHQIKTLNKLKFFLVFDVNLIPIHRFFYALPFLSDGNGGFRQSISENKHRNCDEVGKTHF